MEPLKHSIEIWNVFLPDHYKDAGEYRNLLSASEKERVDRFYRTEDARRSLLCRGILRDILGRYLAADPSSLTFSRTPSGKPFLDNQDIDFNISHSRERLLVAVTTGRSIGVDIEFRRDGISMDAIANRWFAPEERRFFKSLPNPEQGFFDIWAKKEAYVKALGQGIFKDLASFEVPVGSEAEGPEHQAGSKWFFQALKIDPRYAAAVVSEAPPVPVRLRNF